MAESTTELGPPVGGRRSRPNNTDNTPSPLHKTRTDNGSCQRQETEKLLGMRADLVILRELLDGVYSNKDVKQRRGEQGIVHNQKREAQAVVESIDSKLALIGDMMERGNSEMVNMIKQIQRQISSDDNCNRGCQSKIQLKEQEINSLKKQLKDAEENIVYLRETLNRLTDVPQCVHGSKRWASEPCLDSYDSIDNIEDFQITLKSRVEGLSKSQTTLDTLDTGIGDVSMESLNVGIQTLGQQINELLKLSSTQCQTSKATIETDLPGLIKGFCVNIQDAICSTDRGRMHQFSRSLGIKPSRLKEIDDELDYRGDVASVFWAVVYEWNGICEKEGKKATMLTQILQACDDCRIAKPLEVMPMPTDDRVIVEKNCSYLVKHLMIHPTLIYLRDYGHLTPGIARYVTDPKSGPEPEKVLRLLDILPVCGYHALDILVKALRQSGQEHVANHIIKTNPQRFSSKEAASLMCSNAVANEYRKYPRQELEREKKRSFWKKPFRFFKSRKYKL